MVELVGGLFMDDLANSFVLLPLLVLWCPPMWVGCGIRLMHLGITQISVDFCRCENSSF